jgi:hypothetical protein
VDEPGATVSPWVRGRWSDAYTLAWRDVQQAACPQRPVPGAGDPPPGASLFVPMELAPGQSRTVALRLAWYVGWSPHRLGKDPDPPPDADERAGPATYRPWYAGHFADVHEVARYWHDNYDGLRASTARFRDCLYDTTLPAEVVEAVAANLSILRSPTVLRQADGRLWCWEGCGDRYGSCAGSCTHVWNYAQATAHLFPALERTLRETEFFVSQDRSGHQAFRSGLPIRPVVHDFPAAADGQLGGIIKVHREWRISGDTGWLRRVWPQVRRSLDYCIGEWDPDRAGVLARPHHTTFDIEFWGPDPMCMTFYLGALRSAAGMGAALGEDVQEYAELADRARLRLEQDLFNGEYFRQKLLWKERADDVESALARYSPELRELAGREGPKYQCGEGCLSCGLAGVWLAELSGLEGLLDARLAGAHMQAVYRHNFRPSMSEHVNCHRGSFANADEGGLVICTWPRGERPSLPFYHGDEVWTGIEYAAASQMIMLGMVGQGLELIRTCRDRYDGRVRNPFDEVECGHWYGRALASYALLQSLTGARYDAVDKVLHLAPRVAGDFRSFLAWEGGYGTVGVRGGEPFVEIRRGDMDAREVRFCPYGTGRTETVAFWKARARPEG